MFSIIKRNTFAKSAVLPVLVLGLYQTATASVIFDTFDEYNHTTNSSNTSAGDISSIVALGAPVSNAAREIIAAPGTSTVDTSSGGTFTGVGNYTQFRYGSVSSAGTQLNLDLSGYDGFEFDVLSVSGSTTPSYSLQLLSNGIASHFYTSGTFIASPGTYNLPWSVFNGSGTAPSASDLMDIDGVIMINNYAAGSGTLQYGELRLVPEPSSCAMAICAIGILGLRRRRSK